MSKSMVIKGGNVLLPSGQTAKCDILIENGIISKIDSDLSADEQIDAAGCIEAGGLVRRLCCMNIRLRANRIIQGSSLTVSVGIYTSTATRDMKCS